MRNAFLGFLMSSGLVGGHQDLHATPQLKDTSKKFDMVDHVQSAVARAFLWDGIEQSKPLLDRDLHSLKLSELQIAMLGYINTIRKEHKLPPFLFFDYPLAQEHSKYLSESGEDASLEWNDHFDAEGRSIFQRMMDTKIFFTRAGENLAIVPPGVTVRQVVDAWMESTMGHREALLSTKYQQVMIGHHPGSKNVVLDFVRFD